MLCCVIGGGGFIGHHLCESLSAAGRDVIAVGRKPISAMPHSRLNYRAIDAADIASLRKVLSECDEVIDLAYATVPKTSFIDPMFDLQSNLPRVVALMEELRNYAQLRRLVVVSSGGTVNGHVTHLPISENSDTEPVSPYGITKLTIERYALMYCRLHSLPVVIVRPANAYGKGQQPFVGQGFIATAMGNILRRKSVTIYGEQGTVRDYVHVRDVASGILAALQSGQNGEVYNIGSGVGRSNLDIIDLIRPLASDAGFSIQIQHEAERKFDVAANVLNFGRLLSCSGWLPKVSMQEGLQEMWHESLAYAEQR